MSIDVVSMSGQMNKLNRIYMRKVILLSFIIGVVCVVVISGCAEREIAYGVVYEDDNENEFRDSMERGIAGVLVSNGHNVVLSDVNGNYRISAGDRTNRWIAVTPPDGYHATDKSYVIDPDGSESLNFGLHYDHDSSDGTFSFIHGADIQYIYGIDSDPGQLQYDFDTMERLSDIRDVRFYTCAGDLTIAGDIDDLNLLKEMTDGLTRPFYAAFGGHDGIADMISPKMGNYVSTFGPYSYSWNYGGVHFISLVSESEYLSREELLQQWKWLDSELVLLSPETPVVILTHASEEISETLADIAGYHHNLIAVLQGHYHIHNLVTIDGVPVFNSGPWRSRDWGAFTKRVRIVTIDDGKLTTATRVMGQDKRIEILSPSGTTSSRPTKVAVNVYDTVLEPDKVIYRILAEGGREWVGGLIQQSDWTWMDGEAKELPEGKYQITVDVTAGDDMWSASTDFEIVAGDINLYLDDDWPCILGPGGRALPVADDGLKLNGMLELAWVTSTGTMLPYFSSPVVSGEMVCQGLTDGQVGFEKSGVICLDAKTGRRVWRRYLGSDVIGSVAAEGGRIYALTNEGRLYGFDDLTGETVWSSDVYADLDLSTSGNFSFSMNLAPVTSGSGMIYIGARQSYLLGYSAATGDMIWQSGDTLHNDYQVAGVGVGIGALLGTNQDSCAAFDLVTGSVLWKNDIQRQRGASTPVFSDGSVYLNFKGAVKKFDAETGHEIWSTLTTQGLNYVGVPAVGAGQVVVSKGDVILALDKDDGKELWTFYTRTADEAGLGLYQTLSNVSSPALYGRYVFVGGDDGYFYVLDVETGEKLSEYRIGTPIKASPAISGNMIFVSGFDGNVYAFVIT